MFEKITSLEKIQEIKYDYVSKQQFEFAAEARMRELEIIELLEKQRLRTKKLKNLYKKRDI